MDAARTGEIAVDRANGAVTGAALHERLAISALRLSGAVLRPLHDFGFSYVARATRKVLPSTKPMVLKIAGDSFMRVDYCDAYWSTLLSPGYQYEEWISTFLLASSDVDYGFIDGGANHGYWSILVSGKDAGSKPVVAIEAASDTFAHLEDNRRLNGGRFTAINRAIGAVGGERVLIYGAKHEARTTVASGDAKPILDCVTISLDEVAAMEEFAGVDKFVVKLDVEGVEIAAFSGAVRLLASDSVFIYEEHGSDRAHETTRYVIEKLGLKVFWLGRGEQCEIVSLDRLDGIKKSRRFGYDMVATKSPFWLSRLESLVAGQPRPH